MTIRKSLQTSLIHSDYRPPEGFAAFPEAVHRASTVFFKDVAAMRARNWQERNSYTYGLYGTPTSFVLEARIAALEGGKYCALTPSGLSAITMVDLAFLKQGDDVLVPDNAYGPNRELALWLARDFGISTRFYDPLIGAGIVGMIQSNTRLIWVEAPGSISMEVSDIPAICEAAREKSATGNRVLVAMDNTWSAGIAFHPFEHGVDISMQALTKYQGGGADVLMGAVVTRDESLIHDIRRTHVRLGLGVSMDDCYLVLRGLSTMKLRFDAHDAAARKIAAWLKQRPEIAKVLHPAFDDCPGHSVWKRDFSGAGGLFSVIFDPRYSEAQTDRFIDSLKLFKIGFSWGGPLSLCLPYRMQEIRQDWTEQGELVRFNIGLEDSDNLIADIEQAFASLTAG